MARQIRGLIEAALAKPGSVERHRDEHVGAPDQIRATLPHQPGKRPRQRAAAFVFQGVNDRAQRAVVFTDCTRPLHMPGGAAAARALRERHADRAPRGQRIAARVAQRRCERKD